MKVPVWQSSVQPSLICFIFHIYVDLIKLIHLDDLLEEKPSYFDQSNAQKFVTQAGDTHTQGSTYKMDYIGRKPSLITFEDYQTKPKIKQSHTN